MSRPSIKSYLVQAIWNWCTDVGLTPYILVKVDDNCVVPKEFVEDGQIIFDISTEAAYELQFEEKAVHFQARFGEKAMHCYVPYKNIAGMFPQEEPNKGMMFSPASDEPDEPKETEKKTNIPVFSRVK